MWDVVGYGDADFDEDRRALEALLAAVPTEMHSLANTRAAKDAWDTIAAARIGSNRARRSTLQKLRQEWEDLAFKPGEDVDDFALRLNTSISREPTSSSPQAPQLRGPEAARQQGDGAEHATSRAHGAVL